MEKEQVIVYIKKQIFFDALVGYHKNKVCYNIDDSIHDLESFKEYGATHVIFDDDDSDFHAVKFREETDAEYELRLYKESIKGKSLEELELLEYQRLKAKFEKNE